MIRQRLAAILALAALLSACGRASPDPRLARRLAALPQPTAAGLARLRAVAAPYGGGDPGKGRDTFAACAGCHTFDPADDQATGPHLRGVFGAPAASRTAYPYSPALKSSGVTWDASHLDRWLFNPHEMAPGTRMSFVGIRNDARRRDVIAYLISVS